jgi:hypothetical protein
MEKLIVNGEVAVLYTNNFGAGWSTWNKKYPECLFDPEIAKMVGLGVSPKEIQEYAEKKYGEGFDSYGADHLTIKWLPEGTKFYIDEYDGFEEVVTEEKLYITA